MTGGSNHRPLTDRFENTRAAIVLRYLNAHARNAGRDGRGARRQAIADRLCNIDLF